MAEDHNPDSEMVGPHMALEGNPVVVAVNRIVVEDHTAVVGLGVGHGVGHMD